MRRGFAYIPLAMVLAVSPWAMCRGPDAPTTSATTAPAATVPEPPAVESGSAIVCRARVDGAIGPATATYISRAIDEAAAQDAQCLVIELDTPGGLLSSTQKIVEKLLSAPIPVVVYVAPSGASAASAGTFITMAADIAAMAPTTNIGAAHPVSIGASGGVEKTDDTMKEKLENYASSYIETIATRRKRNAEWAQTAVRQSASITAEKALEIHVIDLIASDQADLLRQLDGRHASGRILRTAAVAVVPIDMSLREEVFQLLWRPEVMFILMLIAMYGIIGEMSSPGAILPGVVGGIAVVLLLYLSSVLPLNVAGLALIVLSLLLFITDVFAPTHGILTVGGVISFFLGSLMMFHRGDPLMRISLAILIPATLVTAAFFLFIVGAGIRAQWLPVKVGHEAMIGRTASTLSPLSASGGKVFIDGEYWRAVSDVPVEAGREVQVVSVQGLTLTVKPKVA